MASSASGAFLAGSPKLRLALKLAAASLIPAAPVAYWYYGAVEDRKKRAEEVRTKVRVPNVQTVDDLLVEKCQPGDVVLFDRRCEKCAAGPLAALSCLVARGLLCDEEDGTRSVDRGSYDHCGIVVPGPTTTKSSEFDPSNLQLLEATAGDGVVSRSLLTRLEMSQSRTVLLLPLSSAGERRNDPDYDVSEKTQRVREYTTNQLSQFRDKWLAESKKQDYRSGHATLGILGALGYALNLYQTSPAPVSPSAWLVVSALQDCGAGENVSDRSALETRVEDFLRDHRFYERDTVRLRPGWKFLAPVTMRETSRS